MFAGNSILFIYNLFGVILGDQCMIGSRTGTSFGPIIIVINVDDGTLINWNSEPTGDSNAAYASIAVDHENNILYAAEDDGTLWQYDIETTQGSELGSTGSYITGLVFNSNDGFLYGIAGTSICQITTVSPTASNINCNYGSIATSGRGLLITKDGSLFYYVDYGDTIRSVPFANPTSGNTQIVANVQSAIGAFGFTYLESIGYLNDDPNDNRVVLGCDDSDENYGVVIYDIDTGNTQLVFSFTDPNNFNVWITGIEPLYQDYEDCASLVPQQEKNVCPCYMNINTTIEFDAYECCDVGIVISSCENPNIEYGLKENERTCYVKENGIETITYGPLSDKLYYLCENELLPVVNTYSADIDKSKNEGKSNIYMNKFKSYFSFIIDDKEVVSPYLIAMGISFIIFICAIIGLIGYCLYTCFCQIQQATNKYHNLNTASEITTSDTNTDL